VDDIFNYEHPFVCTDAVLFSLRTQEPDNYRKQPEINLSILLYKRTADPYNGKWCLPGGFLNIDEMPEDNILRKLSEKSYIDDCMLEQLHTFCDIDRDPRARVISIAYMGLMNEADSRRFDGGPVWFTVRFGDNGPMEFRNAETILSEKDIGFDHCAIIRVALERLRSGIMSNGMVFRLLPEEFTLTQLQNVCETVTCRKEPAANFRRKIMDMVQETDRCTGNKGHRPAKMFRKRKEAD
jgi:ADP-ribose pyrophosphatase YjhB (NUDIX family)